MPFIITPDMDLAFCRQSPYAESRKWGVYYVVGLILKCYFRVCLHSMDFISRTSQHQIW